MSEHEPGLLLELLVYARENLSSQVGLSLQLSALVVRHRPNSPVITEAVAMGDSEVVGILLGSPLVDARECKALATSGLLAWNEKPFEHGASAQMLSVLMAYGANANLCTPRGDTVVERLGERIGTIEGSEARAMANGKLRSPTLASEILRECWGIMEESGVDMAEARRVRNMAMEPAGLSGARWGR